MSEVLIQQVKSVFERLSQEKNAEVSFTDNARVILLSGKESTGFMNGGQYLVYNVDLHRIERICAHDVSKSRGSVMCVFSIKPFQADLTDGFTDAFYDSFVPEYLDTIAKRCGGVMSEDVNDFKPTFTKPIPRTKVSAKPYKEKELYRKTGKLNKELIKFSFYLLPDLKGDIVSTIAVGAEHELYPNHKSFFFLKG